MNRLPFICFCGLITFVTAISWLAAQPVFDPQLVTIGCATNNPGGVAGPVGTFQRIRCAGPQTIINKRSTVVTNAVATATLVATVNGSNYLTGLQITATGATAAACVQATVAGTIGQDMIFVFCAPAGATVMATPLIVGFDPPIPTAVPGAAITATLPALGAGNALAVVDIQGFSQ